MIFMHTFNLWTAPLVEYNTAQRLSVVKPCKRDEDADDAHYPKADLECNTTGVAWVGHPWYVLSGCWPGTGRCDIGSEMISGFHV
jgi:hypothetical protein